MGKDRVGDKLEKQKKVKDVKVSWTEWCLCCPVCSRKIYPVIKDKELEKL